MGGGGGDVSRAWSLRLRVVMPTIVLVVVFYRVGFGTLVWSHDSGAVSQVVSYSCLPSVEVFLRVFCGTWYLQRLLKLVSLFERGVIWYSPYLSY